MPIIGKAKKPRCMKKTNMSELAVDYEGNSNAWMNDQLFEKFLTSWNREMRRQKRRIAVFLDNCSAHPKDVELANTELSFLPPSSTSVLQSLDWISTDA